MYMFYYIIYAHMPTDFQVIATSTRLTTLPGLTVSVGLAGSPILSSAAKRRPPLSLGHVRKRSETLFE